MRSWCLVLAACTAHVPPAIQLVETVPIESALPRELPEAADVWVDMIGHASKAIDIAQFYVSNTPDGRLEPVIRALEAAAARGVKIRLLVEHSFVKVYPDTLERLDKAHVEVRHLDLGTGGILHAKYFIVDGHDAFLGSQNFDWRALTHNLELGARIRDDNIAAGLEAIFASDWAMAGGQALVTSAPPSALVGSPSGMLPIGVDFELPALVARVDAAKTSVHLEALTYKAGEWDELEAPLRRAAGRGVQVELLVADWAARESTIGGLQALARVPNVEVRMITIPPWSGGFIPFARVAHAKLFVADGARGWLGTSNWERDYFYKSRNVALLIDDTGLAGQLERFFGNAWKLGVRVDPDARYTPPRVQ